MEKEKMIETVIRAQNGDCEALNELFNAYYNDVYYFASKTVKDMDIACDITQETFVEVITTLGALRDPGVFLPWLRGITYHQCTRYFKKKKDVLVAEEEDGSTVFDTMQEERTEFIPDESLDQHDFRVTVMAMIDTLSEEQRAAVLMYYFDELPVKTIADIQGVSESAVKSRLMYARKAIKRSVEDYEKKHDVCLHSVTISPLLLWLFSSAMQPMSGSKAASVASGVSRATGTPVVARATVNSEGRHVAAASEKNATTAVKKSGMNTVMKAVLCTLGVVAAAVAATVILISNTGNNANNDHTNHSEKIGAIDESTTLSNDTSPVITGEPVWVRNGYIEYNADGTIAYEKKYSYDVQENQLTMKTVRSDGVEDITTCTYDKNGNLLNDGWNSYDYNDAGMLVSFTHNGLITVNYYDTAGNLLEEKDYEDAENKSLRAIRMYDADGNMVKSEEYDYDGGYLRYEYTYDDKGNKISRDAYQERGDYRSSTHSSYEYNENGLLSCQTTHQDDGLIITWIYQYDTYGNEVLKHQKYSGKGKPTENKWENLYQYDENGNVLECKINANGENITTETYTYYPNGTMKSKTVAWLEYREIEMWDEEGHLIEFSRFNGDTQESRHGYTYEQILVAPEAVARIQAQQANLD